MAKFYLPVTWEEYGVVTVEADSIESAIEYFIEHVDDIDTPDEKFYVDGSFRLTTENIEDVKAMHEYEDTLRNKNNACTTRNINI